MATRVSLIIVTVLHLSLFAFADNNYYFIYPKDTTITVNNNLIKLSGVIDTIKSIDPVTLGEKYVLDYSGYRSKTRKDSVILLPVPVQLNGEKIYSPYSDTAIQHCAKLAKGKRYLAGHLQRKMKMQYKRLSRAGYNADIRNLVISKEGSIVYYEYSGLYKTDTFNPKVLKQGYLSRMDKKAHRILDKVAMMPATVNNTTVSYRIKHYELL